ncbi:MAG: permease [Candidatus Omnitrophota bacterium]
MAIDPVCGMTVDEHTAGQWIHNGQVYYFCSSRCLEKFQKENGLNVEELAGCVVMPKRSLWKSKTFIVAAIMIAAILLSYVLPFLVPLRYTLISYFKMIWWAILLGLFLGGVIDYYVPREYVSAILANPRRRTIFYSVLLGFSMSVCSHGILALSIQLHKKGASNPAVVAFLLASPWANMPLTLMLFGFFGVKSLYVIFSAIVVAIITGLIYQYFETHGIIEKNLNTLQVAQDFSITQDIKRRFRSYHLSTRTAAADLRGIYRGLVALSDMVLWWILIGMGIAGIVGAYVPSSLFHTYLGPTFLGLFVTLFFATIIEVCSEGSAPLAFEIYKQTGAFGNSLVYLMAGVATDYTEIGLLWHNVGRKVAIWLPIVTVPQIIILGFIANRFL